MKRRPSDFLSGLPAAWLVVAGFAGGGALVTLVVRLLPDDAGSGLVMSPVRSTANAPTPDPQPEPDRRPKVPAPFRSPVARVPDPIDADSMTALIEILRDRELEMPVENVDADDLRDDFDDPRPGGRSHQALDILAPRGTPVIAVEDGTIASLDPSQGGGGIVVYQFDPTGEFLYYYAHLDGFAAGLAAGGSVQRGDVLGYVGTTGNAPPDTPHLHFAISKTRAPFRPHGGTPINPAAVLR